MSTQVGSEGSTEVLTDALQRAAATDGEYEKQTGSTTRMAGVVRRAHDAHAGRGRVPARGVGPVLDRRHEGEQR